GRGRCNGFGSGTKHPRNIVLLRKLLCFINGNVGQPIYFESRLAVSRQMGVFYDPPGPDNYDRERFIRQYRFVVQFHNVWLADSFKVDSCASPKLSLTERLVFIVCNTASSITSAISDQFFLRGNVLAFWCKASSR